MGRVITVRQKGDFSKTKAYLHKRMLPIDTIKLRSYGEQGVRALKNATPVDTGKTRDSWWYNVEVTKSGATLVWFNDNYAGNGQRYTVPVAILVDNGHATKDGKWVPGAHFIERALDPVINACIDDICKGW